MVVVCHRHRLLGERRHLLRPLPRGEGVTAGSDRSVAVRVGLSFQFPVSSFRSQAQFPVPSWNWELETPPASFLHRRSPSLEETEMQDYRKLVVWQKAHQLSLRT